MKFKSEIEEVIDLIERWLDGEQSVIDKIEDITFDIVADDDADSLIPEDVLSELHFLNMHDIENPLTEDFINARKVLKKFLKAI